MTAWNRPDFRTGSDFRKRHLEALAGLFQPVLKLCRQAGLVDRIEPPGSNQPAVRPLQ